MYQLFPIVEKISETGCSIYFIVTRSKFNFNQRTKIILQNVGSTCTSSTVRIWIQCWPSKPLAQNLIFNRYFFIMLGWSLYVVLTQNKLYGHKEQDRGMLADAKFVSWWRLAQNRWVDYAEQNIFRAHISNFGTKFTACFILKYYLF